MKKKSLQQAALNYLWDPTDQNFENILSIISLDVVLFYCKYEIIGDDDNDRKQVARIAIWQAINEYDPCKGLFINFAKIVTKRVLITRLKASYNNRNLPLNKACRDGIYLGRSAARIAEDQEWEDSNFNEPAFHNLAYDPSELAEIEDQKREKIEWLKKNLTRIEYQTLLGRCNNKSYIRISDELGLNFKQIDNAIVRARCKARLFFLGDRRSRWTLGK